MQGRQFLDLAQEILVGASEVHWRGTVGRAYYGLLLECRDALSRWGFTPPPRDNVHTFVRLRFIFAADADVKSVGRRVERLVALRNKADYVLTNISEFKSEQLATDSLAEAKAALALLDAIEADGARRIAAIAAIRKAFP